MDISLSTIRRQFYICRLVARDHCILPNEIGLSATVLNIIEGSTLNKLEILHATVFAQVIWGRLLMFLRFAQELELTKEEWDGLFIILVPTLSQL